MMTKAILELNDTKPIILIDGSYYVFYRYFATMRWFSFQKKEFEIESITNNQEFIESFIKHLESDLKKICKKWKTDLKNIVFCTDCQRCKIWRNDIYKDYKASRVQNANFNGNIFNIFYEHLNKLEIKKIWFERLEADDIIYLVQNKLKKMCDTKIVIITNDNDYLQLADKNIIIMNMQLKDITLRGTQNARCDLHCKAIYGDKSDNIQKIASFITKDSAKNLSHLNDEDLKKWLNDNGLMDRFQFNMNLISFEHIPIEYVKQFYDHVQIGLIH
jgi:5'-3' exonuclease